MTEHHFTDEAEATAFFEANKDQVVSFEVFRRVLAVPKLSWEDLQCYEPGPANWLITTGDAP